MTSSFDAIKEPGDRPIRLSFRVQAEGAKGADPGDVPHTYPTYRLTDPIVEVDEGRANCNHTV